jgi:hypothetical protein
MSVPKISAMENEPRNLTIGTLIRVARLRAAENLSRTKLEADYGGDGAAAGALFQDECGVLAEPAEFLRFGVREAGGESLGDRSAGAAGERGSGLSVRVAGNRRALLCCEDEDENSCRMVAKASGREGADVRAKLQETKWFREIRGRMRFLSCFALLQKWAAKELQVLSGSVSGGLDHFQLA